jgi:hypothetical protein
MKEDTFAFAPLEKHGTRAPGYLNYLIRNAVRIDHDFPEMYDGQYLAAFGQSDPHQFRFILVTYAKLCKYFARYRTARIWR